ncbi:MAG: flagellar protein FlgN [Lachnospiraceae bacterium]|nr:flagellar protein FlgN [Lachnospiraceae bacterium]
MASLVEDLLKILETEKETYDQLYELAESERAAIIDRKLDVLEETVSREQDLGSELKNLENARVKSLQSMAIVLGKDGQDLTVSQIIDLLGKTPVEQQKLKVAKDALVESATRMQMLNQQNQVLLNQAMELVDFDLTLFRSLRQAPETANYNRGAYATGEILPSGGFDAKQ